ncbi:MAG: FecR domain-containing protein [Woeseia sp.]
MTDEQLKDNGREDDSALATLLNLAGPSAEIPQEIEQRVYQKVRSEWQLAPRRAGRKRVAVWALPFALAASVLVAVLLVPATPETPLRAIGSMVADGREVFVGDVIDTATGGGSSIWLDGEVSLRVDAGTQLRIAAADEFTLLAGRVYIDTGDRIYADRHVTISTASGRATDVGTQFAVSYDRQEMRVAVREGRVDLADDRQRWSAQRGEALVLRAGQAAQLEDVAIVGPEWDWAVALAPDFDLEDHTVLDFLKWVSRETGLELVFDDDELRSAARSARSHGSIRGLTPLEAVEAVLATTQFKYSIDSYSIAIRR